MQMSRSGQNKNSRARSRTVGVKCSEAAQANEFPRLRQTKSSWSPYPNLAPPKTSVSAASKACADKEANANISNEKIELSCTFVIVLLRLFVELAAVIG